MKITFLGLGVMGFPMAGHLLKSTHSVCVFNRNPARASEWLAHYGADSRASTAPSIAKACENADVIFSCLGNDDDLSDVMLSPQGVLAESKAGAVICDHTTSSAKLARELYRQAANRQLAFLDAPVSGGQVGAEQGTLSIMVGGEQAVFESVQALLACYGKTVQRIGDAGSGQLAKMVNQICITGIIEGLAEALNFGRAAGLDLEKVLEVIQGGAAQSWQMDNRAHTMLENRFDFGFAVDWMRKDLAFVLDEAKEMGLDLSLVKLVDGYYEEVQRLGGGRWDTSSLIARYQKEGQEQ